MEAIKVAAPEAGARPVHPRHHQERARRDRRRDGQHGGADRPVVRGQGGARLLDRALQRRRRADRPGHLPSAPHGRHAVCHRGGRAGLRRRHARGRRLRDERPLGWEHAPSRRGVRQARLHGRRPRRLRGGARPPDGHRRPGRGGQRERFDRDLPGRPSPSPGYVSTIPESRWRRSSGSSSATSGCRTS